MDFFDLLASTPPRGKKRKIGEHGESPQLTPDMKKCEGAHSTDVKNDVFEEEHGPVLKKSGRRAGRPYKRASNNVRKTADLKKMSVEQRLKKWGLDKEFTVRGGSRLGCITCMKYGAWCEQEGADTKKKKKKKKETKKKKKKEKKEKTPTKKTGERTGEKTRSKPSLVRDLRNLYFDVVMWERPMVRKLFGPLSLRNICGTFSLVKEIKSPGRRAHSVTVTRPACP